MLDNWHSAAAHSSVTLFELSDACIHSVVLPRFASTKNIRQTLYISEILSRTYEFQGFIFSRIHKPSSISETIVHLNYSQPNYRRHLSKSKNWKMRNRSGKIVSATVKTHIFGWSRFWFQYPTEKVQWLLVHGTSLHRFLECFTSRSNTHPAS
jgi:hypothetical protein